ncbi:glycosyltransferase [Bacillus salipaludis]|uniref:Glycosyltransferase n=1 Tax=Bacillus salipaludis TaxID=2547811 RepID=A0AA90TQT8_9BACI|nr:glycosyltransferase [Bacillus salipaludis]MDQ6598591.1 glycosyltransferase [Bacillus salipaludis]
MPYYSFVILCFNNWGLSKQAITSLIESLDVSYFQKGIELIIINNGSEDYTTLGILEMERQYQGQIHIIPVHRHENMGYPVGINCGLEHCSGEIISILSNDLVFPENWFDGIRKTMEEDPAIGVAVPYLSYGSGPQHLGVTFHSLDAMKEFAKNFMESHKENTIYLDRVIGACMVFKKNVIELIGGNDFWYGIGNYDDDDWSLRVRIAGFKLALVGGSFVHHIGCITFNQDPQSLNSALTSNYYKFQNKWKLHTHDEKVREQLITTTRFNKDLHFYPVKIGQFREPIINRNPQSGQLNILVIADWSSQISNWKEKIGEIASNNQENSRFTFWIPSKYYGFWNYELEIKQGLGKQELDVTFLNDDIPHINLLQFLSQFDKFVTFEKDHVNRYLKSLAQHCLLDLI